MMVKGIRSPSYLLTLLMFLTSVNQSWAGPSLVQGGVHSAPSGHYDELYQDGKLRPQYQSLQTYIDTLTARKERNFLAKSRVDFQGDNSLNPIPRILTVEDSQILQKGVEQRARAIVAFLKDHYSGKKQYLRNHILKEEIVENLLARTGQDVFANLVNPETLAFMYGPDIIRDADGTWRVIEDNIGFIGGIGDLPLAKKLTLQKSPQLTQDHQLADPIEFYRRMTLALKEQALRYGGKAILYCLPPYVDKEDSRIKRLFAQFGIETVTPNTKKKLKFTRKGVYLQSWVDGREVREKVGYIFLNSEHIWVDSEHPTARRQYLLELANTYVNDEESDPNLKKEIKELLLSPDFTVLSTEDLEKVVRKTRWPSKSRLPGFLQAALDGRVGLNYSPGVDFVGDKEFYVYMEKLIHYYLQEEPILKNIPTLRFVDESTGKLRMDLVEAVAATPKRFVIKRVDGRGGDAVWVGAKLKKSEMMKALRLVTSNPQVYIVQAYMPLSVLGGQIVDLRSITAVLPGKIIVSEVPWGRGLPLGGNGKVNLSDQGREVTILVQEPIREERLCRRAL